MDSDASSAHQQLTAKNESAKALKRDVEISRGGIKLRALTNGCTFITLENQSKNMRILPISACDIWLWLSNVMKVQPLKNLQFRFVILI